MDEAVGVPGDRLVPDLERDQDRRDQQPHHHAQRPRRGAERGRQLIAPFRPLLKRIVICGDENRAKPSPCAASTSVTGVRLDRTDSRIAISVATRTAETPAMDSKRGEYRSASQPASGAR